MRPLILTITAAAIATIAAAQTPDEMLAPVDLSTPEAAVYSLMRGMYQGDASMIDAVMLDDGVFRRVTAAKDVTPDGLENWRDWVSTLEPGAAHEELFAVTSEQFGSLATVWAPFVLRLNGEIANCGVNTMTLAERDGDWRVVFGIDTPAPLETCGDFKDTYPAE